MYTSSGEEVQDVAREISRNEWCRALEVMLNYLHFSTLCPVLKKAFLRIIIRKMSNCGIVLKDNKQLQLSFCQQMRGKSHCGILPLEYYVTVKLMFMKILYVIFEITENLYIGIFTTICKDADYYLLKTQNHVLLNVK